MLTQPLAAAGVSVSARLLPWESVGVIWRTQLCQGQADTAAPRAACSSGDSLFSFFPCSSSFHCHIPQLQSSASSPALFPHAPNESCLPEPQLTLEKGEVLLAVCSGGCVFNRALHSVDPKSSPEVLHIQSHSCSSIWLTDKFRICPAGDPMCM